MALKSERSLLPAILSLPQPALAVGGAVATALVAGGLFLFALIARGDMTGNAAHILGQWQGIFAESEAVLQRLNAVEEPLCSPEMLRDMRYEVFQSGRIKDIGAYRPGEMVCTTGLGMLDQPMDEGVPQMRTADGMDIYIDAPVLITDLRETAVILRVGRFNAIPHRPVLDLKMPGVAWVTLRDGASDKDYILQRTPGVWPDGEGLEATACEAGGDLCVHMMRPWGRVTANEAFTLTMILLGGLAGGWAAGLVAARAISAHRMLLRQLRRALRRDDGLTLVYQPIIDLQTTRCVGAEALVRWTDERGRPVPPDVFVPMAEEHGLIHQLTARVIRLAGRELTGFLRAHPDFTLCLNIAAEDLTAGMLERDLETHLLSKGIRPEQVVIELTERRLADETSGRVVLERLHDRGHGIAVDDFGTGYSSLAALRSLPFTELKIDRGFVQAIRERAIHASLLPQIVDIAHSHDLRVIAEGVETENEAAVLRALGVPLAQGWLYSKALPAADLAAYVARAGQVERVERDAVRVVS